MKNRLLGKLSPVLKRGLLIILEDKSVVRQVYCWYGKSERKIYYQTIRAAYARNLVKIVVESKYKKRHMALLTQIGEYVARDIQRETLTKADDAPPHRVSEESSRFIVEAVG